MLTAVSIKDNLYASPFWLANKAISFGSPGNVPDFINIYPYIADIPGDTLGS